MNLDHQSALVTLATANGGCFSAADAGSIGIKRRQLLIAEKAGLLFRILDDVYCFGGRPADESLRRRAALLQLPGAVLTHQSMGRALGLPVVDPGTVTVSTAAPSHRRYEGTTVHRVCDLFDSHLTTLDGIPGTTLERTIVDLAAVCSGSRLGSIVDEVTIRSNRTSITSIGTTFLEVNRRGRRGVQRLVRLLDSRTSEKTTPRSSLEARMDELLGRGPFERVLAEHPLPSDGKYRGFVDRLLPDALLIVEIDGRRWHARNTDMANDRRRDREAAGRGYQTLRVLGEELDHDPDGVLRDIMNAYSIRRDVPRVNSGQIT